MWERLTHTHKKRLENYSVSLYVGLWVHMCMTMFVHNELEITYVIEHSLLEVECHASFHYHSAHSTDLVVLIVLLLKFFYLHPCSVRLMTEG